MKPVLSRPKSDYGGTRLLETEEREEEPKQTRKKFCSLFNIMKIFGNEPAQSQYHVCPTRER